MFLKQSERCCNRMALMILACGMMVVLFTATSSWAQLNVLLITLDDMNYNSTGVTGCSVPSITPNMDALAAESLRFEHAHVNVAVCQPCRAVLMTGMYSHRNGAIGFDSNGNVNSSVDTLIEVLDGEGYYLGILGKTTHLVPYDQFPWDELVHGDNLGIPEDGGGRDPQLYYNYAKSFIQNAQSAGKPFFLMANSHDPHHPFETDNLFCDEPEVDIPGFLPDLFDVRTDLARYYTSTHRGDQTVGKVLQALTDYDTENGTNLEDNTLVMCMSDHGMAFPFAKANAWFSSTNTPWMVRWPGVVTPGVDSTNMISGIDFMPTILDALNLTPPAGMDGTSFLPLLTQPGSTQEGRDRVHTMFYITAANNEYPMRSIQSKKYGYIYNDTPRWGNEGVFTAYLQIRGLTWDAMDDYANANPGSYVEERRDFYSYRILEELYDYEVDPDALNNLASDPQYLQELWRYRLELQAKMNSTSDPLASIYTNYLNSLPQTIPAIVTQHPSDQNASLGETATFTVVATGSNPLSYQWQKDQSDLSNGGHYSGCTTATLTVSSADSGDEASYRCVVTNAYGSETSNEATLTTFTVNITQQPTAQSVCPGSTVLFNVVATGQGTLTYQWQKNQSDLSNGGHYSGATTATLTISDADSGDQGDYRCIVTDDVSSLASDEVALTVQPGPTITQQPSNQMVQEGETAPFSVAAFGSGTLTYQWQKDQSNLSDGGHYSGVTTAVLTVSNVDSGDEANYRCIVTDDCGSSTSDEVLLIIATCGSDNPIQNGDFEGGFAGGVANQWVTYQGGNLNAICTWSEVGGEGGGSSQQIYRQYIRDDRWQGIRQTFDTNIGDAITFEARVWCNITSTALNGVKMSMRVDWDGGTDRDLATQEAVSYRPSASQWYDCGTASGNATGTSVTLFCDTIGIGGKVDAYMRWDNVVSYRAYVPPAPAVSSASSTSLDVDVNPGCNSSNSNAEYAITIGGGGYTLGTHWVQPGGTVGTSVAWQTDAAWGIREVTGLSTGITYTFKVKVRYNSSLTTATSLGGGAIGVPESGITPPTITQQPSAQIVYVGENAQFNVAATGEGTLTYQWQKNQINLSNGGHYSGVTTTTLTITGADSSDMANYRCVVTNEGGSISSNEAALTLLAPGDLDADDDVDLQDFGEFQACLDAGGQGPPLASCQDADLDSNNLVDAADLAIFLGCMSGEGINSDLDCAN